jgi:hypothetical protein
MLCSAPRPQRLHPAHARPGSCARRRSESLISRWSRAVARWLGRSDDSDRRRSPAGDPTVTPEPLSAARRRRGLYQPATARLPVPGYGRFFAGRLALRALIAVRVARQRCPPTMRSVPACPCLTCILTALCVGVALQVALHASEWSNSDRSLSCWSNRIARTIP